MPVGESELKAIRIDYSEADKVVAQHATHMTVQVTPVEFVVSFYQVVPPLLSGLEAEQREQMAQIDKVQAHCVGRIAIAVPRVPEFVRLLVEQAKGIADGGTPSHVEEKLQK